MTQRIMTDSPAYNCNLNTKDLIAHLNAPRPFDLVRQSFMHDLAREGDLLSAEVIFDSGAAVLDLPNDEGRRPLHEAAFYGHLEMVKFFITNGAELDSPISPFGHTALYLAVQQSRYDVVQYLIRQGAQLGVTDALLGTGLLHIAAAKDDLLMVGLLVASGIDVCLEDKKGQTARDAAIRHGHYPLACTLLKVMEHHARYII